MKRTKPNLVEKKDCRKEEEEALRGVFEQDEILKMELQETFNIPNQPTLPPPPAVETEAVAVV